MRRFAVVICIVLMLFFCDSVYAGLELIAHDDLGNGLIYDNDLDITWYDFTNSRANWAGHWNWANDLIIDVNGVMLTDWRLPIAYDNTAVGHNIVTSELGYLFHDSLGNYGSYDGSHDPDKPNCGRGITEPRCLQNRFPFEHLKAPSRVGAYWTQTLWWNSARYPELQYLSFDMTMGKQLYVRKGYEQWGIAVMDGKPSGIRVPVAPEPLSIVLFMAGGTIMISRRLVNKHKK